MHGHERKFDVGGVSECYCAMNVAVTVAMTVEEDPTGGDFQAGTLVLICLSI